MSGVTGVLVALEASVRIIFCGVFGLVQTLPSFISFCTYLDIRNLPLSAGHEGAINFETPPCPPTVQSLPLISFLQCFLGWYYGLNALLDVHASTNDVFNASRPHSVCVVLLEVSRRYRELSCKNPQIPENP